ncbi:hypothetical protein TNCT_476411 [Trichonephila clavata]|uniref:C2H2-type domain-containing protein n=1 Tax=Trichonephila clavata TaxID=2740835 RepID=A0A8X6G062_TRICU|nr:hypothetical protein TNCT_476411 [Trichonephila clavata]
MADVIPAMVEGVSRTTPDSPRAPVDDDATSQRSNSPSVLDIILAGDLSQQSEADLNDLLSTWQEKLTGSPPSRAFGPPTYAATAKAGKEKRASVSKLWHCSTCPKKFYTEKGRDDHEATCQVEVKETPAKDVVTKSAKLVKMQGRSSGNEPTGTKNLTVNDTAPADTKKTEANLQNRGDTAQKRTWAKKKEIKAKPAKTQLVYCRHCDRRIHLATTLEQHYLKKHFRKLSPGTENASSLTTSTPGVTPSIEEHAGRISARKLDGPFRCGFCERLFGSERTLTYHTWNFHKVRPPPKPRRPADDISRVNAHPGSPPKRSGDHFSCVACSVKNPLVFLTQAALDEHLIQCHTVPTTNAPVVIVEPTAHTSSATWCPDCALFINQKSSLAEHIRLKHNQRIVIKNAGPTRTKIVKSKKNKTVDSPNRTESTQFHVTCPDSPTELLGAAVTTKGKKQHGNETVCETCNLNCKTRKGLTYHRLRDHGVSVGRANPRSTDRHDPIEDQDVDTAPIAAHTAPTRTGGGSPIRGGVAMVGETLRLRFPLPQVLPCPVVNCTHSFRTANWYTTNTSVKKHLTSFHRLPNHRVEYWCAFCNRRIQSKPALHPCLDGVLSFATTDSSGCNWPCVECGVIFTTKNGLLNHEKYHKRKVIQEKLPKLRVIEGPKARRDKKKKKLAPILTGEPGTRPLAPVPDSPTAPVMDVATTDGDDHASLRGRIDLA